MMYSRKTNLITRIACFLIFFNSISSHGIAQIIRAYPAGDSLPVLQSFASIPGFPEQRVWEIQQDSTGFMWMATDGGGLARFDGRNVKVFTHREDDSNTIASNTILQVKIDRLNRLWLFYHSGSFDLFDPVTEKVRHLSTEIHFLQQAAAHASKSLDASQFECQHFFEDSRHRAWIVMSNLAARVDAAGKEPIVFYQEQSYPMQLWLTSVNETPEGHLIFGSRDNLVETDQHLRMIRKTLLAPQSINKKWWQFSGSSLKKGDTLYLGGYRGVNVYNMRTGQLFFREGLPGSAFCIPEVTSPHGDRFLFFDTSSHHLYTYISGESGFQDIGRYEYGEFDKSIYNSTDPLSFRDMSYCIDRWGGLWHSRFSALYSSLQRKPYTVISGVKDYRLQVAKPIWGLPDEIVAGWNETSENTPWLRSPEGAVYVIDSNHTLKQVAPAPYAADPEAAGKRWLVIYQGSIFRMLSAAVFDDHDRLWIADFKKMELFTIDPLGNIRVCPQKIVLGYSLMDLLPAKGNGCWATNFGKGLYLYTIDKGLVKTIGPQNGTHPLPEALYTEMLRDSADKNLIWINTVSAGLIRFNERDETWIRYTQKEGLPAHDIYSPMLDRQGNMWYCTKEGIYRFNIQTNNHQLIYSIPVSQVKGSTQGFHSYVRFNQFYFSLANSAVVISPEKIVETRDRRTALTGIRINNKQIADGDTSLVPAPLNTLASLHLAYNQNFISFQFAALDYAASDRTRYRYRMTGIDKEWVGNTAENTAQYTSLPPGDYVFEVNATNADNNWSTYVKSIRVVISPPWWRTLWMYAVYASCIAGAIWLYMRNRLRQLQLNQQVVLKQKEAEQAQALEETKSRFFANITHELRTPLTLILSPVQQQLRQGKTGYSPQLLKNVYHNSLILLRLINQLLDMSKLEAGNMPVTYSRGPVGSFVESLLPGFRQQAAVKRVLFSYQSGDLPEESLFDADKLEKVIFNLLSNAFKFTPEGGNITLSLQRTSIGEHDAALIRVTDTGIGIAAEHLPHIFDRFYQVNTSTTRRYEGTGIGLALVKDLVELNGGRIQAESTAGQGSVFTVHWPLLQASEHPEAPALQPHSQFDAISQAGITEVPVTGTETGRPVVLVADDNEQLRTFIKTALEPSCQVLTAVNGEAGLQTARAELPDLIISDLMMPVMDGLEFCAGIKADPLTSHIGFVLLTAKTADESRIGGLRLGADHYLGKPFIVEELLLVASNLLNRQEKLREHYRKQLQPEETLPPVNQIEDKFLASVYSVIENHLDNNNLDVEFLAGELAVSRRTLNRKLSALAGTSANEVIRNYRLKKAASLLLAGHSVSEAAYATGFSTPSWFSQCFKELYGVTPVQYTDKARTTQ